MAGCRSPEKKIKHNMIYYDLILQHSWIAKILLIYVATVSSPKRFQSLLEKHWISSLINFLFNHCDFTILCNFDKQMVHSISFQVLPPL